MAFGTRFFIFYQNTSMAPTWVPRVSKNREGHTDIDFRGFGCDHEVLKELEAKNLSMVAPKPLEIDKCGPS